MQGGLCCTCRQLWQARLAWALFWWSHFQIEPTAACHLSLSVKETLYRLPDVHVLAAHVPQLAALLQTPASVCSFKSRHVFPLQVAATACTIVSGAIAERTRFEAYACYSFFMSAWVYPIITHSAWSFQGWASMFK